MADVMFPGDTPVDNVGTTKLPTNLDLTIWQGDYQEFIVAMTTEDGSEISLDGATAQAVIRASFNSPTQYPFECTIQNGNEVRIYMSSADCAEIPAGSYLWNFQITGGNGDVRTYLAGDVTVYGQVDA
jgi:hypothetical protein